MKNNDDDVGLDMIVDSDLPEGCLARNAKVVWMDPPPTTVKCTCGCTVPSDKPCHCGARFEWRVDPFEGWTLTTLNSPNIQVKIKGRDGYPHAWDEMQNWLMLNVGSREAEIAMEIMHRVVEETEARAKVDYIPAGRGEAGGRSKL